MSPQERARRIASGLSQSQIQNLDRWGYPYVLSEFRFHMTLTGAVPPRRKKAILAVLLNGFRQMKVESSIAIDRLALMKQQIAGSFVPRRRRGRAQDRQKPAQLSARD